MNKNSVLNLIAFMIVGALMGFVLYLFWTIAGQAVKEISIVTKTVLNNLSTVILIVGVVIGGMVICLTVSWAISRVLNFFVAKDDYDIEKIKESCKETDKAIQYEDKMAIEQRKE